MKKFFLQFGLVVAIIIGALLYSQQSGIINTTPTLETKQLKIKEMTLNVEVADTSSERAKGLGGRKDLPEDGGMLFIFDDLKKHRFWMKGMKIPIDIIWIKDDKVVDFLLDVQPPAEGQNNETLQIYEPVTDVNKVLEVNSGFVSRNNIRIGDNIELVK